MVTRGLIAPLSVSEEIALRRIALGIASHTELSERNLRRLRQLELIDDAYQLTLLGRERYDSLPRPSAEKSPQAKLLMLLAAAQRATKVL
jgi:hypothetical protein